MFNLSRKELLIFAIIGGLFECFPTFAQTSQPSAIEAHRIESLIQVDGVLNEKEWADARKVSNFTQRELFVNQPVTERTEVAIIYNSDYLYVGVWCYDSNPQKIIAKEYKRDFEYDLDDNFILIFDTYRDQRNGFMFVTNPNGARSDLQIFNNGGSLNKFWNGVWDVKTTKTDSGWFAEFKIPFSTLKYSPSDGAQVWSCNFERNIRRKREQARWQGWGRDNTITQVNQAGQLLGLNHLRDKRFVEVKPYAIGGLDKVDDKARSRGNAGVDVNYLLTPTYRLNLTVNTDFAQVESDQQQINLTRFPLFFPELREFFLEGNDFFDMGFGGNRIVPFYTRNIGLDSNREAVPILGGARLLGKEKFSTIGLMNIVTGHLDEGTTTNYSVASYRRDVGKQSVVGGMSVNKFDASGWHTTTGFNGRYNTNTFLKNKNLNFGGSAVMTYRDQPLNGIENGSPNVSYRAFVGYPNDQFTVFASTQRSPLGFEPEVGLMRRRNFEESFLMMIFSPRPKKYLKWIRQYDFRPAVITLNRYDDTKKLQSFEYQLRYLGISARSGDWIYLDYKILAEGLIQDFKISDSITIAANTYWWQQSELGLASFEGRTISVKAFYIWGEFFKGKKNTIKTEVLWRAHKHVNFRLNYEQNDISLPEGSFQTQLVGSRIEYALTPNAFGALFGQWNSSQEVLNINFRLQLIPKLGTDFYLIINQIVDTSNQQWKTGRATVLGKLIWRFVV
jgi:hypothetical protein